VRGESRLQINPIINSEMWYPVSCPTMTQVIKLRLDDDDGGHDDDDDDDGIDVILMMAMMMVLMIVMVVVVLM